MIEPKTRTEIDAAMDAVRDLAATDHHILTDPRAITPEVLVLETSQGRTLHSVKALLDEYLPHPERRRGTAVMLDLDSFIAHVNRFREGNSAVFADNTWKAPKKEKRAFEAAKKIVEADDTGWTMPSLTAVLDYHEGTVFGRLAPGYIVAAADTPALADPDMTTAEGIHPDLVPGTSVPVAGTPGWCQHRAHYRFPLSEEFKIWTTFDGAIMDQSDLAQFLEERCLDIIPQPLFDHPLDVHPDSPAAKFAETLRRMTDLLQGNWGGPHDIMDMSRTMRVHESSTAEATTRTTSGTGGVVFKTEHTDGAGEVFRPKDLFLISIPVFKGGPAYQLPVRLRYRLAGGNLLWFYEIFRVDKAFDHAFSEACEAVREGTDLPLFIGHPEK